jgi:transposase-like protein
MWMWTLPYEPHPEYAAFKAHVYSQIDPRMRAFFPASVKADIRLDEIDTGGVAVNGIPPLYNPSIVPAADARYLRNNHVVFGIVVNGEARAYPKRILAWHELAVDKVGGVDLTVVYCTLCGTVIPYESRLGSQRYIFGTSGLLYRSNKLMFDQQTNSLWSSIDGRPVVGPLVGSGLQLVSHPVVTTTWGEWRATHPDTTVLSIETGFDRDYREGAAYRDYFNTDRLMFESYRVSSEGSFRERMEPMARPSKYSPELRERAVRMVFENTRPRTRRSGRRSLVAEKLGCTTEALRRWVRQAERDTGTRPGLTTTERQRVEATGARSRRTETRQ